MEEKERQELELEDILKEFGPQQPPQGPEELPEAPAQPEEVRGDTIRLDQIQKAVRKEPDPQEDGDVRVYKPLSEDTGVFRPVTQEDIDKYSAEINEAYEKDWEPEYEEPAGDYTPPIEFKPKSRLQHLRAKLVAGPEKRYYELSEQGFGKLQAGIFLNLLIFLICAGSTVLFALDLVGPERLRLLVFLQVLCLLLAGLVGCYRLLEGVTDLLRLKFTLNTLLAFTFLVCCMDAVLCLQSLRVSCGALFCLEMLMAQMGAYERRHTQMGQMDTLRKAAELEAVVKCPDYFEEKPGFITVSGEPEDFMDHYVLPSTPERALQIYGLVSLAASVVLGVIAGIRGDLATGVQITAGTLLLSMPATAFISMSRPENLLERRLHKLGTVLCGWQGIRQVPQKLVVPVAPKDLFPGNTMKLNGVKFYGSRTPDLVVAYAASLATEDGGSLAPVFQQLLSARGGNMLPVEDLQEYEGGVSGVVGGAPVSLGTMEFMKLMGVELPLGTKLSNGICLAVDGELAGLFAITFTRSKSAVSGLRTLCSYRNVVPVVSTCDFLLTESFIRKRLWAHGAKLRLPDRQTRQALAQKRPPEEATAVALLTREGLAQKAFAITGARVLKSSLHLGAIIHILGGGLGLVAAAILTWIGALELLTPANLLVYSLIWMIPGWLVTQWTRSI